MAYVICAISVRDDVWLEAAVASISALNTQK